MRALLRNRIVRAAATYWWAPSLVLVGTGLGVGGLLGPTLAAGAVLFGAGATAGAAGAIGLQAKRARQAALRRHAEAGYLCVCPRCLAAPGLHFVCEACGAPVEEDVVHTEARWVNSCGGCGKALRAAAGARLEVAAHCPGCRYAAPRAELHERRVAVLAAATPEAFQVLLAQAGPEARPAPPASAQWETPAGRVVLLSLAELAPETLAAPHAGHHLTALWIAGSDALRLGQILDTFTVTAGRGPELLRGVPACVQSPELPPELRRLLEHRFREVETGVTPGCFLTAGTK